MSPSNWHMSGVAIDLFTGEEEEQWPFHLNWIECQIVMKVKFNGPGQ